ncbi:MAG: hypothetical protein R8K49_05980 [Mariprofundaceae bacterium]
MALVGAVAVMLPLFSFAASDAVLQPDKTDVQSVDVLFDKTGDAMVNASDWSQMSPEEQLAYARASIEALGEAPDALMLTGQTRVQEYLKGLHLVYD